MRRNWLIAAIVIGVASIVVAAVAMRVKAANDDSGSQSTQAWASSVCTSLSDWRDSITSLADVSGGTTLTPDTLKEKLDSAATATSQLVTELKDLGPPDLEAGDELKQQLQTDTDDLQSSFDQLKEGAQKAADAGSGLAFLQQLATLAPQFQAFVNAITQTVSDLQNSNVASDSKAELQQAFDDAPSCQSLRAKG